MTSGAITKARSGTLTSLASAPAACTMVLLGEEIVIPPSAHTLPGFRVWAKSDVFPERGRISFINKEIVIDMSPEEIETHIKVKMEIGYGLMHLNKKTKQGEFYGDGTLVTNAEANLSTEPDGSFVKWESLDTSRVRLIPREGAEGEYLEVEGTPDWLLEVVSKSSVRKDTEQLRERYHRAGIPEYWLVNARGEDIDFQILLHETNGYVAAPGRGGWQESRQKPGRRTPGFWSCAGKAGF
jgi:Uma2 family endonuclease